MGYLDNAGLAHLWGKVRAALSGKQDRLTGQPGQAVGFDADGTAQAVQGWSNPNLLDNWYFVDPINQMGQKKYVTDGPQNSYTIDRWIIGWDADLSITQDGIVISDDFFQKLAPEILHAITGRTVTISLLTDTSLYSSSGNYDGVSEIDGAIRLHPSYGGAPSVSIISEFANYGTLVAAKLELGSQQTLAHQDANGKWVLNDPPPNKALELMKCQRYYQVFSSEELRPAKAMDFRPPLRAEPELGTIKINGVTCYTADANL